MEPAELVAGLINELLGEKDVVPTEAAAELCRRMREEHPAEHAAFLEDQAQRLYGTLLSNAYKSRRANVRREATALATVAANGGDVSIFTRWRCRVDERGTQRQLGEMTKRDNLFAAAHYDADAATARMLAAFHRAIAKKQGSKKVKDAFTEDRLIRLYRSIAGTEPPLAMAA